MIIEANYKLAPQSQNHDIISSMVQIARPKAVTYKAPQSRWRKWVKAIIAVVACAAVFYHGLILFRVFKLRKSNPEITALMEQREKEAAERGETAKRIQTWVAYDRISPNLVRAVLAGEDSRFFDHAGFDWEEMRIAMEKDWNDGKFSRGASTITQQLAKNLFLSTSKNPFRKLHEAIITKEMEWTLGKRR